MTEIDLMLEKLQNGYAMRGESVSAAVSISFIDMKGKEIHA